MAYKICVPLLEYAFALNEVLQYNAQGGGKQDCMRTQDACKTTKDYNTRCLCCDGDDKTSVALLAMQAMLTGHMSPCGMLYADVSRVANHWLLHYADSAAVQMNRHAGWLPVCNVTC